ncbi:alpha/beta hydrolase [Azoarcus sp. DN11]|uniref:alpha/beta fold hydrolase n=1 Tax=Azoarcus sp. DN11 TaxID=356837 RepID=UPI000EB4C6C1|nr:alpha/beta hydrolase [Azoarcus sp. DN11]AYH43380.1 alpha/beta hydrolase [Azoarcus sp. DN11]
MTSWIFLRGLTRESRHWGDFVDVFERTVPDARVVTIDLPGNGPLHRLTSPADVRAMAEFCRQAAAGEGLAPPHNLLAMSLGAMVAVAWAQAHPDEVARCVLINTSVGRFSPFYRRLRPRNYLPLLKLALCDGSGRAWEEQILAMTSRLHVGSPDVLDAWVAIRESRPVTRGNALRQLWAAARYRPAAERPDAEMLILASRNDGLVHVDCSRTLALRWGGEFRVHPRAGHDIPLDDGAWVAAQVRDWVGSPDHADRA